ncbi:hypothetical protein OAK29_02210 [Gammaproteobacteria bacterium]|nr:hypothetical protein [Gammaproteobacteria bacterium]
MKTRNLSILILLIPIMYFDDALSQMDKRIEINQPKSFNKLILTGAEGYLVIKEDVQVQNNKRLKKILSKSGLKGSYEVRFISNDQLNYSVRIEDPFTAGGHDENGKPFFFSVSNAYFEVFYPSDIEYDSIEVVNLIQQRFKQNQKITVQK